MKKALCICLIFCFFLPLFGCAKEDSTAVNPLDFYYLKAKPPYGQPDSIFGKQIIERPQNQPDSLELLRLYLKGPSDINLTNPFPAGTTAVSLDMTDDATAIIVLGGNYKTLEGMDQTLACACLTLTVCNLTGAAKVSILDESDDPNDSHAITMTPESIALLDESNMAIRGI